MLFQGSLSHTLTQNCKGCPGTNVKDVLGLDKDRKDEAPRFESEDITTQVLLTLPLTEVGPERQ